MGLKEYLAEWGVNYFRSMDAADKKITSISREEMTITYDDRVVKLIPQEDLDDSHLKGEGKDSRLVIITFNSEKNLQSLIKGWKRFKEYQGLTIIFINPFSEENRWMIHPFTHDRICDHSSLKLGLKAMFDNVGAVTPGQISAIEKP